MKKKKPSVWKSFGIGVGVVLALIVYAYGFQVTKVNFEETRSEQRLTQLTRIIRALTHPDILNYEQVEEYIEVPFYMPCPQDEITTPEADQTGPYLVLDKYCGEAGEFIIVEGFNFRPETRGPINFIPTSGAKLTIGTYQSDISGYFQARVKLPKRLPVEEAQTIQTISRRNVGTPYFSNVAKATWDKIIETVFLALLATTIGTMLAIPVSFIAARNLMSDVKNPLTSVAFSLIGWPLGIAIGLLVVRGILGVRDILMSNVYLSVGSLVVSPTITWVAARWALPQEEEVKPRKMIKVARIISLVISAILIILAVYILAS
ncbi:MAG TPA: hypothetical protein ENN32_01835, partial [Chloroflexi bacterium]|nr:hypothetical protein [Chloroflexota bacterium]